jgi:hypothetical protein
MNYPTYPPAASFEQPIGSSYVIQLENVSLAELVNMPAAWNIVIARVPSLEAVVSNPGMKPDMGKSTLFSVQASLESCTPELLATIDQELKLLPPVHGLNP